MTTINLHSFKGKHFHDVYIAIMKNKEISFHIILPRKKQLTPDDIHFNACMEFGCAAYAAHLLHQSATDFSYTVPSAYKLKPFEFFIETTEPEKFADVVFKLLRAFNPAFAAGQIDLFHVEAANYYTMEWGKSGILFIPATGLLAISHQHFAILYKQASLKKNNSHIKTKTMSDNKKYTGKKDRIKVDSKDKSEMAWLRKKFPDCSRQAIAGAVRAAGPGRKDIEAYLVRKGR